MVDLIPEWCWAPAINTDDQLRDGAWVTEVTSLIDLSGWPVGSRLILRKERPHPGAQLTFTDVDGMRITAFLTDTPAGVVPGQLAGLGCGIVSTPVSRTGSGKRRPPVCVTSPAGLRPRMPPGWRRS